MRKKLVDLVILDCDGVLVDSEPLAAEVTARQLAEAGISLSLEETLEAFVGLDPVATRALVARRFGVTLPDGYEARHQELLEEVFATSLRPVRGVVETLEGLPLRFCVASNSGHRRLRQSFAVTGLDRLVAGRVFSAEDVARGKPAPDLLLHAAAAMGADPRRCLYLDDSVTGISAAKAARMPAIGFCGASHVRDGYADRLIAAGADAIITDFRQLSALLDRAA